MTPGEELRAAREAKGLSQRAVARLADISRVTLAKYEEDKGTKMDVRDSIRAVLGLGASATGLSARPPPVDVPAWWLRLWREADEPKRMALAVLFGGSR